MNNTFDLHCKCGTSGIGMTNEKCEIEGWMLGKGGVPLCPKCAKKQDDAFNRQLEKRFGKERAQAAIRSVDRLLQNSR